jgi:hypothetical protein
MAAFVENFRVVTERIVTDPALTIATLLDR